MNTKRKVEIFSAGCPVCEKTVAMVERVACPACDVEVLDMHVPVVARRAKELNIRSLPAIVIDGKLADCRLGSKADDQTLRSVGIGQPL